MAFHAGSTLYGCLLWQQRWRWRRWIRVRNISQIKRRIMHTHTHCVKHVLHTYLYIRDTHKAGESLVNGGGGGSMKNMSLSSSRKFMSDEYTHTHSHRAAHNTFYTVCNDWCLNKRFISSNISCFYERNWNHLIFAHFIRWDFLRVPCIFVQFPFPHHFLHHFIHYLSILFCICYFYFVSFFVALCLDNVVSIWNVIFCFV